MRSRSRIVAAVGSAGVLVLGGVLAASPAAAGPNCPSGYVCVMKDNLNDNKRHDYLHSDNDFRNDYFSNGGGVVNGNVSAASNSSTQGWESHFYEDIGYQKFLFCVNPGSYVNILPPGVNDHASSMLLRGTTTISCF